jgi:uncharacterized membrane protein
MSKPTTLERSNKWLFGMMLGFGIVGLVVSFILSIDEIQVLKNPDAILSCSVNAVLNCSTVMQTWQAHAFGFPNMFIGLMAFPVVITTAVVALCGATLPRLFWRFAVLGFGLGLLFSYWLFFNSVYVIQVLCPWCLVITFTTTMLFEVIMRYSLRENIFGLGKKLNDRVQSFLQKDYDKVFVAGWVVFLIVLVFLKFGSNLFI